MKRHPSDDIVGPCRICGKMFKRGNVDEYCYYDGVFACKYHYGVKEWYLEALYAARAELKKSVPSPQSTNKKLYRFSHTV